MNDNDIKNAINEQQAINNLDAEDRWGQLTAQAKKNSEIINDCNKTDEFLKLIRSDKWLNIKFNGFLNFMSHLTADKAAITLMNSASLFIFVMSKNASKQSIHEKKQIDNILAVAYQELKNITIEKSQNVFYRDENGKIMRCQKNHVPVDGKERSKSLDCTISTHNGLTLDFFAKYTAEAGGSQDNQSREAKTLISSVNDYTGEGYVVFVLDGAYYDEDKIWDIKNEVKSNKILLTNSENLEEDLNRFLMNSGEYINEPTSCLEKLFFE